MKKKCKICKKIIIKEKSESVKSFTKRRKYCSKKCFFISKKGVRFVNSGQFKKGMIPHNKGIPLSDEVKKKLSNSLEGKEAWNKGKKGIYSQETLIKMREAKLGKKASLETRLKRSKSLRKSLKVKRGREHHSFINGQSDSERHKAMKKVDYIIWRTAVFIRDNYSCQECGQRGGKLEADHIKPYATYPELRYAIDNGRTLCVECHRKTLTWGINVVKRLN